MKSFILNFFIMYINKINYNSLKIHVKFFKASPPNPHKRFAASRSLPAEDSLLCSSIFNLAITLQTQSSKKYWVKPFIHRRIHEKNLR